MKKKWVEYEICRVPKDPTDDVEAWEIFSSLEAARERYSDYCNKPGVGPLNEEFVLVRNTYEVLEGTTKRTKKR